MYQWHTMPPRISYHIHKSHHELKNYYWFLFQVYQKSHLFTKIEKWSLRVTWPLLEHQLTNTTNTKSVSFAPKCLPYIIIWNAYFAVSMLLHSSSITCCTSVWNFSPQFVLSFQNPLVSVLGVERIWGSVFVPNYISVWVSYWNYMYYTANRNYHHNKVCCFDFSRIHNSFRLAIIGYMATIDSWYHQDLEQRYVPNIHSNNKSLLSIHNGKYDNSDDLMMDMKLWVQKRQ